MPIPFKHVHKWVITKIKPGEMGWGRVCQRCRTMIDSGLTKESVQRVCDELNRGQ